MFYNSNKLNKKQINVLLNLAEFIYDDRSYTYDDLTKTHPVSSMYMSLSKGMTDLTDEFEYSMIAELIQNSIFNDYDSKNSQMSSEFIKKLSILNDDENLNINIGKLAKYLL